MPIHNCTCFIVTSQTADELEVEMACDRTTKSEFAPGHDAKLKALLISAHRKGQVVNLHRGDDIVSRTAMEWAAIRGWEQFLTFQPKPKAEPKAKAPKPEPTPWFARA